MRRWFELGELEDTTYASDSGDKQFLQLPQKREFITFLNQYVGKIVRVTNNLGDSTLCDGINDASGTHPIHNVSPCNMIVEGSELRGMILFTGLTPVFQGLCRQYFEKPGINDGPNDTQTVEVPRGSKSKGGTLKISLFSYLVLLLNTWQGVFTGPGGKLVPGTGNVPQRWITWLQTLILHYSRYTPTQIYGFLARVDFSGPTFKV